MVMERIAALDPGREKCGFAVLAEGGEVLMQRVIETAHRPAKSGGSSKNRIKK